MMHGMILLLALLAPFTLSAPVSSNIKDLDTAFRRMALDMRQIPGQDLNPRDAFEDFFSMSRNADRDHMNLILQSWELETFAGNDKAVKAPLKSAKSVVGGAESVKRAAEARAKERAANAGESIVGSAKRATKTMGDDLAAAFHDKIARWQSY